jgi:hypothetical protein
MKKQLVIFGIIVLLICVGLSGCNEDSNKNSNSGEKNIGDSIIFENIKFTFLSAYWEDLTYYLNVKLENIGSEVQNGYVVITKYEMKNGYKYETVGMPSSGYFNINPGKSETKQVDGSSYVIDKDFLPVSKIYLSIKKGILGENGIEVILNV